MRKKFFLFGSIFYILAITPVRSEGIFLNTSDSSYMGLLAIYLLAESADPALAGQIALRDQSLGNLRIAEARKSPRISSRFSAGPNNDLTNNSFHFDRSVGLNFSLPLIDSLADYDVRIEEIGVERASQELEVYRQFHLLMVAESYFEVLSSKQDLIATNIEVEAFSSELHQAEERLKVGVGTRVDVDQARAQLDLSRVREIKFDADFESAKSNLSRLIDMAVTPLKPLSEGINVDSLVEEEAVNDLIETHPQIIAIKKMLEIAHLRLEKAKDLESISLDLNTDLSFSDGAFGSRRENSISLKLEVPIFSGDRTEAAMILASSRLANMEARVEEERRLVNYNIKVADRNLTSGKRSLDAFVYAIRSAESRVEATEGAYSVGSGDLIEVLNAKKDLIASQRDFEKARYQQILNGLRKALALGLLSIEHLKEVDRKLIIPDS